MSKEKRARTEGKRGRGRPPKPDGVKEKFVQVRVTAEQLDVLKRAALKANRSVGDWIRLLAVTTAEKELKEK